jgi:hypothetical protein
VALTQQDLDDLRRAKGLIEKQSLAARIANTIGKPIEQLTASLPGPATAMLSSAVDRALRASLNVAIRSLGTRRLRRPDALHKVAVGASGAIGGAFGLAGLGVELPASTTLMLRSIAEIAQREGESLDNPEARLACLQVLALGGPSTADDAVETGYFAVRAAMAKTLEEAAAYVAQHGVTSRAAPALVRLLAQIGARFGIPVSQKVVAQSVPVIGSASGAALNVLFMDHFQALARGHFIVRRLERAHGADAVREAYRAV